ncbi:hypothetical protein BDN70DRAFT_899615 [Pholiota conissans]|uniref:Uncharacterized protein n=1 Tax=Pholiota conissans TaxID=109636 RepID=A0A9P5YRY9_9AGAR|nr:hypothetical protein BDN70DRAFT_899615 [Pholiota conissans]
MRIRGQDMISGERAYTDGCVGRVETEVLGDDGGEYNVGTGLHDISNDQGFDIELESTTNCSPFASLLEGELERGRSRVEIRYSTPGPVENAALGVEVWLGLVQSRHISLRSPAILLTRSVAPTVRSPSPAPLVHHMPISPRFPSKFKLKPQHLSMSSSISIHIARRLSSFFIDIASSRMHLRTPDMLFFIQFHANAAPKMIGLCMGRRSTLLQLRASNARTFTDPQRRRYAVIMLQWAEGHRSSIHIGTRHSTETLSHQRKALRTLASPTFIVSFPSSRAIGCQIHPGEAYGSQH